MLAANPYVSLSGTFEGHREAESENTAGRSASLINMVGPIYLSGSPR
jgi:hypothetical protein